MAPSEYGEFGRCEATAKSTGERCGQPATGEHGKCYFHGGEVGDSGPPAQNQNAQTHGLFAAHDGYYHDLDDDEQAWVFDFTHTLLDRHRDAYGQEPDMFDREALKNIAIDFHRVATANSWFSEHGMAHVENVRSESFTKQEIKVNVWAGEIRQYNESIYRRMKKHGLLDDPESQQADATQSLVDVLSE